jgi:uncharacterized protein with GYD domain
MLGLNHSIVKHNRAGTDSLIRDYDFIRKDKFHQDIEFSRGSGATQTNSSGLVAYAPENELKKSSQLDTWLELDGSNISVSAATSITDPLGGNGAFRVTSDTANKGAIYVGSGDQSKVDGVSVSSIYIRSVSGTKTTNVIHHNTVSSGQVTITEEWKRITIPYDASVFGATNFYAVDFRNSSTDATDVYIFAPQLNKSFTEEACEHLPTTTDFVYKERFDYTKDGDKKGLLIEEARTNSLPYSQDFSNAQWVNGNTITSLASNITDPSGGNNSYKVTQTTNAWDAIGEFSLNLSTNTAYTFSVYIKRPDDGMTSLRFYDAGNSTDVAKTFTVWTDGVPQNVTIYNGNTYNNVGTIHTPVDCGGGWYRFAITGTTNATNASNNYVQIMPDYFSSSGQHCFVFGAQLEAGSFASSLIPNHGTSSGVTRSADLVNVTGTNFSRFYKDTEGTFVVDAQVPKGYDYNNYFGRLFEASDGSSTDRIELYINNAEIPVGAVRTGNVGQTQSGGTNVDVSSGEIFSSTIGYKHNNTRPFTDNKNSTLDTDVSIPTNLSELSIGGRYNSVKQLNGWIRRVRYFNKRKSDSQLQNLVSQDKLLQRFKGAKAAHSLRSLRDGRDNSPVTRIRREYDSFEADYTANQVANGDLEKDFRSADQTTLPLDVSVEADELVVNGDFGADSDWTKGTGWTIANGVATHTGASAGYLQPSATLVAGKSYSINLEITSYSDGFLQVYGSSYSGTAFSSVGQHSMTFVADNNYVRFRSTGTMSVDSISVKEVNPKGSAFSTRLVNSDYTGYAMRVRNNDDNIEAEVSFDSNNEISLDSPVKATSMNLLSFSEDFGQWTAENATVTSGQSDPNGGQNAYKMIATASSQRQAIKLNNTSTGALTASVFAKKGEYDVLQITDARNGSFFVNFDLTNGTVGSSSSGVLGKIESVGNDWFRCSSTFTSSLSLISLRLSIATASDSARLVNFAGNGSDGLYIYGAQLEETVYESTGTELITNGDFSTSDSSANGIADWQTASGAGIPADGTGTTLVNGKLRFDNSMATGTSSDFLQIFQRVDVVAGRKYSFSGDFDILDGTVSGGGVNAVLLEDSSPFASRVNFGPVTADGTVTGDHVATITETVRMRLDRRYVNGGTDNDVVADIDNISLVEYLPKVSDYTQTPVISDAHNSTSATNLREFAGSADVKVVTWYNQGGGEDFTQITAGNQPKIVLAGSLVTDSGGKASVYFDTADHLDNDSLAGHNRLDSYYLTDSTDDIYALPAGNTGSYVGALFDDGGTSNNWYLSAYATADSKIHINGTELSGTSRDDLHDQSKGHSLVTHENVYTKSWPNFEVGVWTAGSAYNFTGKISEMVFFPNMDSSPKRFPIEQNMIQHFMDGAIYSEDFNDGTGGWLDAEGGGSSTTLSHETTNPISGSGSLKIALSNTGTSGGYPRVRGFMGMDARLNVKYRLSFKAKLLSGSPECDIRFGTSTTNMYFATNQTFTTTAQTYTFTETFDTLAGGTLDALDFIFDGTKGPFELLIDDVKVEELGVEGYVTTLYDQTGNNNHALQATAAHQPQIVSGGDLIKSGNHPAWEHVTASNMLMEGKIQALRLDAWFVAETSDDKYLYPANYASSGDHGFVSQDGSTSTSLIADYGGGDAKLYANGTLIGSSGSKTRDEVHTALNGRKLVHHQDADTADWAKLQMGYYGSTSDSTFNFQGKFSEWIWYDSDQSSNRSGIESNINSHYNIY